VQPYWWSERESSSPARAMVLAHQLFDLIEAKLGMGATPPSPIGDSEKPQQQEQTSLIATAGSDIHITDASANEPNATESAPDLQHLFRARDEALLRMLAANAPEQSTPDQSAPGSTSSTSATTAGASSGGEETTVTVTVISSLKTEAAVANVDGVDDMIGSAAAVTVSTAAQLQQPALRTTATSMCSRCREVMSVHPGLHSAVARANGQEPQHTNWTADFIGYVLHFIILIKCDVRWLRVGPWITYSCRVIYVQLVPQWSRPHLMRELRAVITTAVAVMVLVKRTC
jgi:hypothetical protein